MLTINDPETLRLLQELTDLTGETLAEALERSVAERLERERWKRGAAFHDGRTPDRTAGRDAGGTR